MSKNINRQACEVYTRVVGYLSPLSQWNKGKKQEHADKKYYNPLKGMEKDTNQETKTKDN